MSCRLCASERQTQFVTEINIHFSGLKNLNKPSVLAFPKISICLDCGFSAFVLTGAELALLSASAERINRPSERGSSTNFASGRAIVPEAPDPGSRLAQCATEP
jgi:hypothetical protein